MKRWTYRETCGCKAKFIHSRRSIRAELYADQRCEYHRDRDEINALLRDAFMRRAAVDAEVRLNVPHIFLGNLREG